MSDKKLSMQILQRICQSLVLLMLMISATSVMAQETPSLRWELVNPFRFIRDQAAIDELRDTYQRLPTNQKTAYDLERELQRVSDERVDARRAAAASTINCADADLSKAGRRKCFEPYLGWFADLSKNNYFKTCWNSDTHRFRNDDDCRDYIYPKSHNVRVWIENAHSWAGQTPTWFVDDQPLSQLKTCAPKYQKNFCIELPIDYDVKQPKTVNISARLAGDTIIGPLPITVVDSLIVGLGDSYASGEGNPDRPAQFTENENEKDRLPALLAQNLSGVLIGEKHPRKDNGKDVQVSWLDDRCHRSMYSYQFKTALQLALSNPQEAVTFVSYSCSGAITDDIISHKKKAIEGGGRLEPQLDALKQVLSNGTNETREIDFLLLSIGGNDIGFAKFVTYCLLSGKALGVYKVTSKGVNENKIIDGHSRGSFRETLLGNTGSYMRLNTILRGQTTQPNDSITIKIKDCLPDGPCKRVLLTPYPDIFHKEDGNICQGDRKEFDYPFGPDPDRKDRIVTLKEHVFGQITEVQQDPQITDVIGWTVVQKNVDAYAGNGFCAQSNNRPLTVPEIFNLTSWKNKNWTPFDPTAYKPYAARLRWVRLPIDAKLTTDQLHTFWGKFRLDVGLEDDRSIIMHPTAEGLSKTADANVEAIQLIRAQP